MRNPIANQTVLPVSERPIGAVGDGPFISIIDVLTDDSEEDLPWLTAVADELI